MSYQFPQVEGKTPSSKKGSEMRGAAGKPSVRVPISVMAANNDVVNSYPPPGKIMNREKMDMKIVEEREEKKERNCVNKQTSTERVSRSRSERRANTNNENNK